MRQTFVFLRVLPCGGSAGSAYKVPTGLSLGVIAGVIAVSIVASLLGPKKGATREEISHGAERNAA